MQTLYPVDYVEPAAAEASTAGRDTAAALALIRLAVPKGGTPLRDEVVRKLVRGCAGPAPAVDPTNDLAAAIAAATTGAQAVKAPEATASLSGAEVDALIAQVIAERRSTWKLLSDAKLVEEAVE